VEASPLRPARTVRQSERSNRTRNKLKTATRDLLNRSGPENLRVQDISRHAGVAHGLFYRHFKDMEGILLEVARDFMSEVNDSTQSLPTDVDWFELFHSYNLCAMELCLNNPGITRCFFQLTHKYPQLAQIWQEGVHEWNIRIAIMMRTHLGLPRSTAEMLAFALGAATEGVLFQYVVRRSEDITRAGSNAADIAEIIAVMCCRIVFLRDPPSERLRVMKKVVARVPQSKVTDKIHNRISTTKGT
jgi:AcrR family transcriptional regulator